MHNYTWLYTAKYCQYIDLVIPNRSDIIVNNQIQIFFFIYISEKNSSI